VQVQTELCVYKKKRHSDTKQTYKEVQTSHLWIVSSALNIISV